MCVGCRFLCDASDRIGSNIEELMSHTFFRGIDWEHIRLGVKKSKDEWVGLRVEQIEIRV